MNHYFTKCITCGKFISYDETVAGGGASWVFVPDSDLSYEENYWQCKKCTEAKGPIRPRQSVCVERCSGVA